MVYIKPGCWIAALVFLSLTHLSAAEPQRDGVIDAGITQVSVINREIQQVWSDYEIEPSANATEGEWCRRLYLDLLGRVPSVQELGEFKNDKSADKRMLLINRLLDDPIYTIEFANNWSTIWTNVLIGRSGGRQRNGRTNREGMRKYLRDTIARNKPYDQMVYELITATGENKPGSADFNGAVNFLSGKLGDKATQATTETAKVFMGLQLQCTQCHNHPFNDAKQSQFWQMNAFFRQAVSLRRTDPDAPLERGLVYLADQDFAGEDNQRDVESARTYFSLRNGKLEVAMPVFVDGQSISASGYVDDTNRRHELAQLIVQSSYMPKALVNRMWRHFFGYGFTQPIDDMGPHNEVTHPQLLEYLAGEFVSNSHDVKQLMRWIVSSDAYALSSRITKKNKTDNPLVGDMPKFSHFYLRQMSAEQLYESLLVVTQAAQTAGDYEKQQRTRERWLRQFVQAFGTDEGGDSTTFNGSIPQTLVLFNSDLIKRATSTQKGSFLRKIATRDIRPSRKVDLLYRVALARKPTKREFKMADRLIASYGGNTVNGLQDIWWAILNSNEFILIH